MAVRIKGRRGGNGNVQIKRFPQPITYPNPNAWFDSMILYSLPSQSLFQLLSRAVSNV